MALMRRSMRNVGCAGFFLAFGAVFCVVMLILYGSRSDAPELLIFAQELLPAGHCLCQSSTIFNCATCLDCATSGAILATTFNDTTKQQEDWVFSFDRDQTDLTLSTQQCDAAFPGLFEDIDRAVKLRATNPVTLQEIAALQVPAGSVRAMIFNREVGLGGHPKSRTCTLTSGQLYILNLKFKNTDNRKKALAILYAMQRVMLATPRTRHIPDMEFVFSVEDMVWDPHHPVWVLARKARDTQLWLMPDFGFWSWNIASVGAFTSVVQDVLDREAGEPWADKERKLVWRGKPAYAAKLRRDLLDAAKDKPWSAVRALQWTNQQSLNDDFMGPAEQCKYMFIAHAEGRSYSGSLKYRQLCRSVIVSHKLQWIQHHHFLLVANGTAQNYVEVERDFSDLDATMEDLLSDPAKAKRIADNSVRTFRERYLTPAAEACYWRALFTGWAQVSAAPELYEQLDGLGGGRRRRGVRFESFV